MDWGSWGCIQRIETVSKPVLWNPDFTKQFILQTDASDLGLGAILLQNQGDGRHPIVYLSKKLLPREKRYATVEKVLCGHMGCTTSPKIFVCQRFSYWDWPLCVTMVEFYESSQPSFEVESYLTGI